MSIYRNLQDEIRLRFDITDPIKIQDLLELVGETVHPDDEAFDTLLADLAEHGYQVDIPEDAEEFHGQLGTTITTGARDSVHIWMRELASLDLLTRDQELEYARNLNSSLSEMMAAVATLKPVSLVAQELLLKYRKRQKLNRVLEGFLDNVTHLPTVTRKTGKETTTEKPPPFDMDLAERRIDTFFEALEHYFSTPISRRTKRSRVALENSLRCFKFTTLQLNTILEPFFEFQRSYRKILRDLQNECSFAGISADVFRAELAPVASGTQWRKVIEKLEPEVRDQLEFSPRVRRLRLEAKAVEVELGQDYKSIMESLKRFRLAEAARNRARDGLAEGNYRLVMSVAQKFKNRGVDHEDLIQEGNLGLLRAIEKFDYTRGFKFSTYATWWIRQAVTRALGEYSRTVRLPANVNQDIRAVSRAQQQLRQEIGQEPSNSSIAERIGKTTKQVRDTKRFVLEARTLDKPVGEDDDGATLGDLLPDTSLEPPSEVAEFDAMKDAVSEAFSFLSVRETQIVMMHHGISRVEPMTITQIADELQVSRERVRQIYNRAVKRLGRGPCSDGLRSFLK